MGSGDAYLFGGVDYPEGFGSERRIYKNIKIRKEPLVDKIKALEERLEALAGELSENEANRELEEEIETGKPVPIKRSTQYTENWEKEKPILEELLKDFRGLLKTPYGALGYLVKSDAEDILKLYGVDTEREFWMLKGGSAIRIPSGKGLLGISADKLAASGGRRWAPFRGLLVSNPQELPENAKTTDDAVKDIIEAIKSRLEEGT